MRLSLFFGGNFHENARKKETSEVNTLTGQLIKNTYIVK